MKERPILFSGPMVRALLVGTKTQTRRVVKHHPSDDGNMVLVDHGEGWWPYRSDDSESPIVNGGDEIPYRCPYGQPGDRLWVREAFMHEPADYCWEASVSVPSRPAVTTYRADFKGDTRGAGWKPSIHMPRNLSRILLEITAVRVERLQDISEADARDEGARPSIVGIDIDHLKYRAGYQYLWESINGQGSWGANPWVWCIEFKRLTP